MFRPRAALAVLLCALALVGCTGAPSEASGGGPQENVSATATDATTGTSTTTTTTTTTPTTTTTDETPPYGTQFISVERLENQSRYQAWPAGERAHFRNLSAERRETFRRALNDTVEVPPDEEAAFDFNDKSRPRVVRYEGTWYYVRVAIV
jgi:hypothetical protein